MMKLGAFLGCARQVPSAATRTPSFPRRASSRSEHEHSTSVHRQHRCHCRRRIGRRRPLTLLVIDSLTSTGPPRPSHVVAMPPTPQQSQSYHHQRGMQPSPQQSSSQPNGMPSYASHNYNTSFDGSQHGQSFGQPAPAPYAQSFPNGPVSNPGYARSFGDQAQRYPMPYATEKPQIYTVRTWS